MRRLLLVLAVGCGGGTTHGTTGECEPPVGSTELDATPADLSGSCLLESQSAVQVVDSVAAWNALFSCAQPVPPGIDLTAGRAAVVHVSCSPIDFRFAADDPDEVVVGIHQGVSGACIANALVVPLPRTTKSIRLATCRDTCSGNCPPVP